MKLIKSEFRKVFYPKSFIWLTIGAMGLASLSTAPAAYAIKRFAKLALPGRGLDNADVVDGIYSKSISGYLFVMIIGALAMTGEFKHNTAVATFLASPKRHHVMWAKMLVAAVVGIAVMLISTATGFIAAYLGLQQYSDAAAPHSSVFIDTLGAAVVTGAVLAVIGVAIGTLIRSQTPAVVGIVIYMYLVERLIIVFWPDGGKWLPTGLITSMTNLKVSTSAGPMTIDTSAYLEPTPAIFMLIAYAVVFALLALTTTLRRDID